MTTFIRPLLLLTSLLTMALTPVSGAAANTALLFDGTDFLQAPDDPSLNPTDAITIEVWCMIPSPFFDRGNCPLIEKANFTHRSPWYQYHLGINSSTQEFLFDLAIDGSRKLLRSPLGALPYGEWVHVAGTYDGTMMRLFVNGDLVSDRPMSGVITTISNDLFIGRYANFIEGIAGQIDEVRLWDTAHTPEQIQAMMCTSLNGDEVGLMGCWSFEEGSGQIAGDLSVHGNHALLGNSPVENGMTPTWVTVNLPDCPETTVNVRIDVRPGSDQNRLHCDRRSKDILPVALLTTDTFDAMTVDHATVRFGRALAPEAHTNPHGAIRHEEDVDRDGRMDLMFHFRHGITGIECGDTSVELTGQTYDGQEIRGTDMIDTPERGKGRSNPSETVHVTPNPFNPQTAVFFNTDRAGLVRVSVYDIRGRRMADLTNQTYPAGEHSVIWQGRDSNGESVPSGQYFFRIEIAGEVMVQKALLLK